MAYLLDTGVVLHATRQGSPVSKVIDFQYALSGSNFRPAICEVSVGELHAFTLSGNWGDRRKALLKAQIENSVVIPIAHPGIHQCWAAMSSSLRTAGVTIGHNDIWIASTASVAKLTLLTTDKDFLAVRRVVGLDVRVLDNNTGQELP